MKRSGFWAGVLVGTLGFVGAVLAQGGKVVTVQVLSAKVTKTPSFLAPTVAKVVRGDQLTSLGVEKDWVNVQTKDGQSGWINKTSIVDKAVALSTKPGHPELDFSHIDKIEKLDVDGAELAKFAADGRVGGGK